MPVEHIDINDYFPPGAVYIKKVSRSAEEVQRKTETWPEGIVDVFGIYSIDGRLLVVVEDLYETQETLEYNEAVMCTVH